MHIYVQFIFIFLPKFRETRRRERLREMKEGIQAGTADVLDHPEARTYSTVRLLSKPKSIFGNI